MIRVSVIEDQLHTNLEGPITVPGDNGAFLFRIENGQGQTSFTSVDFDLLENSGHMEDKIAGPIEAAPLSLGKLSPGTNWVLADVTGISCKRLTVITEFQRDKQSHWLPIVLETPDMAKLKVTIL